MTDRVHVGHALELHHEVRIRHVLAVMVCKEHQRRILREAAVLQRLHQFADEGVGLHGVSYRQQVFLGTSGFDGKAGPGYRGLRSGEMGVGDVGHLLRIGPVTRERKNKVEKGLVRGHIAEAPHQLGIQHIVVHPHIVVVIVGTVAEVLVDAAPVVDDRICAVEGLGGIARFRKQLRQRHGERVLLVGGGVQARRGRDLAGVGDEFGIEGGSGNVEAGIVVCKVHALLPHRIQIRHIVFREQPGIDGFQQDEEAVLSGQLAAIGVRSVGRCLLFREPGVQFLVHLAVLAGIRLQRRHDETAPQILVHAAQLHGPVRIAHVVVNVVVRRLILRLHAPGHLRGDLRHQLEMGHSASGDPGSQQDCAEDRPAAAVAGLFHAHRHA